MRSNTLTRVSNNPGAVQKTFEVILFVYNNHHILLRFEGRILLICNFIDISITN